MDKTSAYAKLLAISKDNNIIIYEATYVILQNSMWQHISRSYIHTYIRTHKHRHLRSRGRETSPCLGLCHVRQEAQITCKLLTLYKAKSQGQKHWHCGYLHVEDDVSWLQVCSVHCSPAGALRLNPWRCSLVFIYRQILVDTHSNSQHYKTSCSRSCQT